MESDIFLNLADRSLSLAILAVCFYFVSKYLSNLIKSLREENINLRLEYNKKEEKHREREDMLISQILSMGDFLSKRGDSLSDFTKILAKIMSKPVGDDLASKIEQIYSAMKSEK